MSNIGVEQKVTDLLIQDSVLAPLCFHVPDCGLAPYQQSATLQFLIVTLFIKDPVATRQQLCMVCKHVVALVGPLLSEFGLKGLLLWTKTESSCDSSKRLFKLSVGEQGYDKLAWLPLADLLNEEYFDQDGIQIMRYAPIRS